jgi:hypothetical protein
MELRKRVRYRLGTRAEFTWEDPKGNQLKGVGVTRDISLKGVFIFSTACPVVDATVQLSVFLPPYQKGGPTTRIVTEGRVLRVEHPLEREEVSGFAVVSKGFSLYERAGTGS